VLFEPLNARLLRAMPAHRNGAEVAMAFSGLAIGAVIAALFMIGWEIFAIRTPATLADSSQRMKKDLS
jgi:hypothetical protein